MVEPSYRDLKVQFTGGTDGMNSDDAIKFDNFLADYRAHGNGSLGISVPNGSASRAAITYFGERAAATGISRDKILVSTRDVANGDTRVDITYIAYNARTAACGARPRRSRPRVLFGVGLGRGRDRHEDGGAVLGQPRRAQAKEVRDLQRRLSR